MKATLFTRILALAAVPLVLLATGCLATRKFVRNSQAPQDTQIQNTEQKTAQNAQAIKELSDKTEAGISQAQNTADQGVQAAKQADEHAMAASQKADSGISAANDAKGMFDKLQNFRAAQHATVTFATNKSNLTQEEQQKLDEIAQTVGSTKLYMIQVVGHTDSTGSAGYNLALSQRRADTVVRYLTQKHNIPVVVVHNVGYGEDVPVASNKTREGRAGNRRVEVTILVPQLESQTAQTAPSGN